MPIINVIAIVRLKKLEAEMVDEGFKINKDYTKKMEDALGAEGKVVFEVIKKERHLHSPPTFVTMDEDTILTQEEAAKILQKKRLPKFGNKITENPLLDPPEEVGKFISNEPLETNRRFRFMFGLIKNDDPKDIEYVVRNQNGDLVTATTVEKKRFVGYDINLRSINMVALMNAARGRYPKPRKMRH